VIILVPLAVAMVMMVLAAGNHGDDVETVEKKQLKEAEAAAAADANAATTPLKVTSDRLTLSPVTYTDSFIQLMSCRNLNKKYLTNKVFS